MSSTHNPAQGPEDEATRLAQERFAFLKFMRQVLTPLPPEELFRGDGDGEEEEV